MTKNLSYLQQKIDQAISCLGTDDFIRFMDIVCFTPERDERVSVFLLNIVSIYYSIPLQELIRDGGKTNVAPRMIICHLLNKYLNYSLRKIGHIINRSKDPVNTYLKDMDYYLTNPKRDTKLVANYMIIENQLKEYLNFIDNINLLQDGKVNQEPSGTIRQTGQ